MSSLNSIGQSVFKIESGNKLLMDKKTEQMKRQNYTNFDRNLAMMVIYLPVKFEFNESAFELESRNGNVDGQTDKKRTNKQTELHQFRKKPSYDGDLSPCEV